MKYLIIQILSLFMACQVSNNKKMEIMNKIILHLDKDTFSPFEPIRPGVQIINASNEELKIQKVKLDWEHLAFSSPCKLHLISEDGQELALLYERPSGYFKKSKPILVKAKQEEWFYFPLNTYFPALALGNYKLWLELADEDGNVMKSNTVSFKIVPGEFSQSDKKAGISISMENNEIVNTNKIKVDIKITNHNSGDLTFLNPAFDSFYGWTNPTYLFVVREKSSGRVLPLALRSGSMQVPAYDSAAMFTIKEGRDKILNITLPNYPKLAQLGDYTIQLYYLVRNKQIGKSGTILSADMNWDKNVFVGLIESNVINLKVIAK